MALQLRLRLQLARIQNIAWKGQSLNEALFPWVVQYNTSLKYLKWLFASSLLPSSHDMCIGSEYLLLWDTRANCFEGVLPFSPFPPHLALSLHLHFVHGYHFNFSFPFFTGRYEYRFIALSQAFVPPSI
jgi:hypothetical protein